MVSLSSAQRHLTWAFCNIELFMKIHFLITFIFILNCQLYSQRYILDKVESLIGFQYLINGSFSDTLTDEFGYKYFIEISITDKDESTKTEEWLIHELRNKSSKLTAIKWVKYLKLMGGGLRVLSDGLILDSLESEFSSEKSNIDGFYINYNYIDLKELKDANNTSTSIKYHGYQQNGHRVGQWTFYTSEAIFCSRVGYKNYKINSALIMNYPNQKISWYEISRKKVNSFNLDGDLISSRKINDIEKEVSILGRICDR
jgi:hypothetical protein